MLTKLYNFNNALKAVSRCYGRAPEDVRLGGFVALTESELAERRAKLLSDGTPEWMLDSKFLKSFLGVPC